MALEHNGDVYSCDHFVEPDHLLDNIGERHLLELVDSPRQQKFGQDKHDTLPRYCLDCDVRVACHGGCPKDGFDTTPDGEPGLNHLCAGFKAFFHHIDRPPCAPWPLRRGQPPSLIMREYAEADAHRTHNSPCPWGDASGPAVMAGRHGVVGLGHARQDAVLRISTTCRPSDWNRASSP